MHINKFDVPIFSAVDLFTMVYNGYDITDYEISTDDADAELTQFKNTFKNKFQNSEIKFDNISDMDSFFQNMWFMPDEYHSIDILGMCMDKCTTVDEKTRVTEEFSEYDRRGMVPLLRWLKYFVDTCESNDVVWGVGRGSSVASYILYLIGVHRINSIKYDLDWREFLR